MGFFEKLKNGLKKTKEVLMKPVNSLFSSYDKVDDEFFEELFDILVMSDVGVATSQEIIDGLKEQICAGILPHGQKLPSVRELASQLAINPNTIQRAYRQLEMEGWVATLPGKGCFVCGSDARNRELERWFSAFDEAASALMALGVSRESLTDRIGQGGTNNA